MRRWIFAVTLLAICVGNSRADEVSDLKAKNEDLTSQNIALQAQVDALTRRLATLQGEKAGLDSKFAALTRRLSGIEKGITGLQTNLSQKVQEAIDRIVLLESSGSVRPTTTVARTNTNNTRPNNTRPNTNGGPTKTKTYPNKDSSKSKTTLAKTNTNNPRVTEPVIKPRIQVPRLRGIEGLPTTVAVVDMVEVFNNLREKSYVEESLADLVYAVKFQQKKWAERIRAFELDRSLLEKGSLAYLDKQHEIDKAMIQLNIDVASAQAALNRKRGERMKALYTKMAKVCGNVANDHGFDMILFKEPEPDYKNFRSVGDLAGSRMVLRANESVDLTDQVIRVLNREFLIGASGR